jgi:acetyltransferase-like isoleucine patch superfamily enzyme
MENVFVHPNSIVETQSIGDNTRIWAFVHILDKVVIGGNCNICDHCFIENNVSIGNNVTVKSGIYIWDGVTIEDDVFLGPNVVFTNDIRPRSKKYITAVKTLVGKGASIGANSTILAGVKVGKYAMTGIASVITRDIPDYALYYGNPAKFKCWIDEYGNKLEEISQDEFVSSTTDKKYILKQGILSPQIDK